VPLLLGYRPLHHAVAHGKVSSVEALLAAGSNPNAQNRNGWTPLHYASMTKCESSMQILELLLKAGARVHEVNDEGMTALMLAAVLNAELPFIAALIHRDPSQLLRNS